MVEAANLLYIFKFKNLEKPEEDEIDLFGILKNTIGHINGMKWRPDCGASISNNFSKESNSFDSNFIGYLLTASSNGNGYINCVQDMTMESSFKKNKTIKKNNNGTCTSFDKLNIFECHKEILLKVKLLFELNKTRIIFNNESFKINIRLTVFTGSVQVAIGLRQKVLLKLLLAMQMEQLHFFK